MIKDKFIFPKIPIICQCEDPSCHEICWNGTEYKRGHSSKINPPMKGKKHKLETIKIMKKSSLGRKNSEKSKDKMSIAKKGLHLSPETEFKKGNHPWNWRGNITPLIKEIRECFKSNYWKKSVFKRDYYICQICKIHKRNMIVHHKKEFNIIFKENNITSLEQALLCEELWDINNGITLCKECHKKIPKSK